MVFEINDIVTIKAPTVPQEALFFFRIYKKEKSFGWWLYYLEECGQNGRKLGTYVRHAYGSDLTLVRRGDPCDCEPTKKFKPKCLDCVLKRFP